MTWENITKPAQGASTKKTSFADAVVDDLTHLYNLSGGSGSGAGGVLQNGSFENDVDSDGIPDGWTQTLGAGGAAAFDTTTPAHGAQAYKFTTPGSVDNYIETTDFIVCSASASIVLAWFLKCSAAGVSAAVVFRWYDKAQSYLSSTTLYSEGTASPTSWTRIIRSATPAATTCYCKVRLYGGTSGDATAGDVYFDGVILLQGLVQSPIEFARYTAADTGWATIETADEYYLESGAPAELRFAICAYNALGAVWTHQYRIKIGSVYSNTISVTGASPANINDIFLISIPAYVGTRISVELQAFISGVGSGDTGWAKVRQTIFA